MGTVPIVGTTHVRLEVKVTFSHNVTESAMGAPWGVGSFCLAWE